MEEGVPTIEVPDAQVDAADLTQVYSDSMVNGGKPAAMKAAVEPEKIQDTCDESVFQDAQPRDSQIVPGDASEGVEDAEAEEASEKLRRLEAFVDDSVETAISHCKKCGLEVEMQCAIVRGMSEIWCRSCSSLYTMLQRHMKWPPEGFQALDEKKQMAFFAQCAEDKKDAEKSCFSYQRVKESLTKILVDETIRQRTLLVGGTYLPKSV